MVTETSTSSGSQPAAVKRRTNALKNLQLKFSDIESKLSEEMHKLECKYAKLFEPIYSQREKIVNGDHEPNDEEATWEYDDDESESEELNESANKKQKTTEPKGLPDFWLKTFKSNSLLAGLIAPEDEPILSYLRDVKVKLSEDKPGHVIEFHFNENPYFTNRVLTKTFELNTEKSKTHPLSGDVSPLHKCVGTKIEWKEGKNVTAKPAKPQQRGSQSKDEDEDDKGSFFSMFDTHTPEGLNPLMSEKIEGVNSLEALEELAQLFEMDFEIGNVLKDVIVPKAVLYFTGELRDDDEDEFGGEFGEDDSEDDEDDDDDDDEDEESEEEEKPKKKEKGRNSDP